VSNSSAGPTALHSKSHGILPRPPASILPRFRGCFSPVLLPCLCGEPCSVIVWPLCGPAAGYMEPCSIGGIFIRSCDGAYMEIVGRFCRS
jgi:hypothetical protein